MHIPSLIFHYVCMPQARQKIPDICPSDCDMDVYSLNLDRGTGTCERFILDAGLFGEQHRRSVLLA